MTDIDTILNSVAPDSVDPEPGVVDSDLARGRAALATARRRRVLRRGTAGVAVLATAAVAVVVATNSTNSSSTSPTGHAAATPPAKVAVAPRHHTPGLGTRGHHAPATGAHIQLVDYTGAQLPGFKVTEIPQGWHLSTSNSVALLITPDDGSAGNNPDVFAGKLAVLVQSDDQHGLGPGTPETVNGRPARYQPDAGGGTAMLTFTTADGHGVNVQVPASLRWSPEQVTAFAAGVTVVGPLGHTHG
jgi:hypothetical protein